MEDIYAAAGREMIPEHEYDFTQEYLSRLKGENYIPVRKSESYHKRKVQRPRHAVFSPLMRSINNSRHKFRNEK